MVIKHEDIVVDFGRLFKTLKKNAVKIILPAVLLGGAGFGVGKLTYSPVFEASCSIAVSSSFIGEDMEVDKAKTASALMATYCTIANGDETYERTIRDLNLDMEASSLRKTVQLQVVTDSQALKATVKGADRDTAEKICESVGENICEVLESSSYDVSAYMLSGPVTEISNSSSAKKYGAAGAFLGLAAALCWFVMKQISGHMIFDEKDIEYYFGTSPVGTVSDDEHSFRRLRANITAMNPDGNHQIILVCSVKTEGKDTASGLAGALAASGRNVLLVKTSGTASLEAGFTDMIKGEGNAVTVNTNGYTVLLSGTFAAESADLLAYKKAEEILTDLRNKYEYVILDSSDDVDMSRAYNLASSSDLALISVPAGMVSAETADKAAETLKKSGAGKIRYVINGNA